MQDRFRKAALIPLPGKTLLNPQILNYMVLAVHVLCASAIHQEHGWRRPQPSLHEPAGYISKSKDNDPGHTCTALDRSFVDVLAIHVTGNHGSTNLLHVL